MSQYERPKRQCSRSLLRECRRFVHTSTKPDRAIVCLSTQSGAPHKAPAVNVFPERRVRISGKKGTYFRKEGCVFPERTVHISGRVHVAAALSKAHATVSPASSHRHRLCKPRGEQSSRQSEGTMPHSKRFYRVLKGRPVLGVPAQSRLRTPRPFYRHVRKGRSPHSDVPAHRASTVAQVLPYRTTNNCSVRPRIALGGEVR